MYKALNQRQVIAGFGSGRMNAIAIAFENHTSTRKLFGTQSSHSEGSPVHTKTQRSCITVFDPVALANALSYNFGGQAQVFKEASP